MSGHPPDFTNTLKAIPGRKIPKTAMMALLACIAIGIAAAGIGFTGDAYTVKRAQGAFVVNFMYFNGIIMGGFVFCAIGMITYARWHRRFKRIAEAFTFFMPVSIGLLLIFLLLGGIEVYPWFGTPDDVIVPGSHKDAYFQTGFFYARQIIGLGILYGLSIWFARISLRPDIGVATDKMKELGLTPPPSWSGLIKDWKGEEEEVAQAQKKMMFLSPIICILYTIVFSVVAVDLSMSLAPHFFANMFPAWYFMSCCWSGLVWTSIFALTCGDWLGTSDLTRRKDFHDIGKLTFAFTMFWGYTTFAHYLPIWYGNMTEEIGFILYRTHGEVFGGMTQVMIILCFAAPYTILFSRGVKKIPAAFLSVSVLLAIGIWLERYITNVPSIHSFHVAKNPNIDEAVQAQLPLGFIEIGMALGFLGLFVLSVLKYLEQKPGATLSDPIMHDDPEHIEIHVAHGHH